MSDALATSAPPPAVVAVYPVGDDTATRTRAAQLSQQLGLPLAETPSAGYGLLLGVTAERLELRTAARGGPSAVYVDFVGGRLGYRCRRNRSGLLFDAVGLKTGTRTVIDATAGLGRDAFLLAYYGCQVTAIERSAILAALLQDGLDRAARVPELSEVLRDRLRLVQGDARAVLGSLSAESSPDVIYLDPMFPPKKKSALVKKEMRILRQVVGDDVDAAELLDVARGVARRHVVVKRMRHAPPLAPNPTRDYGDKTTRYDVYRALQ